MTALMYERPTGKRTLPQESGFSIVTTKDIDEVDEDEVAAPVGLHRAYLAWQHQLLSVTADTPLFWVGKLADWSARSIPTVVTFPVSVFMHTSETDQEFEIEVTPVVKPVLLRSVATGVIGPARRSSHTEGFRMSDAEIEWYGD